MFRSRQSLLLNTLAFLSAVWTVGMAPSALALTSVYFSPADDGLSGGTTIPETGLQSIYLYINGGPTASAGGSACHEGSGDEVCGYDVELTGLNGLTFSAFNEDPGADLLVNLGASSLRINGLDTTAPSPGPQRIGELQVNSVTGGEVELTSGEVIGANLESEALSSIVLVAAPEPTFFALLASGVAMLTFLARLRSDA